MNIEELKSYKFKYTGSKYIRKHFPELYETLRLKYPDAESFSEKVYRWQHDLEERPKCRTCGGKIKFVDAGTGFRTYCSFKCRDLDDRPRLRHRQTCIIKYGKENYSQTDECKERIKKTNRKKYGTDYYLQTKECRGRINQTKEERYGDKNYNNPIKSKLTSLKRYDAEFYTQTDECKERIKKTNRKKYGTDYYLQTKECRGRINQTNLDKYGVKTYAETDEFKEFIKQQKEKIVAKGKQTSLERYGVESYTQTDECKAKKIETCQKLYGKDYYLQTDDFKNQAKNSSMGRYGAQHYTQTDEYKQRSYKTRKQNHTFNTSKIEKEFKEWLDSNNINYKYQYRSEEYPFNCDFYFPDKNLYLEIQGSWVHGHHPFDPESAQDQKTLQSWKDKHSDFYDNAIETWTTRDPKKRLWAREHKLNWIEVFSTNFNDIIETYLNHTK